MGRVTLVPGHLRRQAGRGWRVCQLTGFVRNADEVVSDVRNGLVAPEYADATPGFGTHHPQDLVRLGVLDDPTPIPKPGGVDELPPLLPDIDLSAD